MVIAILDYIKELGFLKEVYDEGEYWETRSIEKLAESINESTTLIMSFLNGLRDTGFKIITPVDECKNFMIVKKKRIRG